MQKFISLIFYLSILTKPIKLNAQQKIAYIDYTQLLLSMPETKEAQIDYKKYVERWDVIHSKSVKQFMVMDSLFNIDSSNWTPAIKDIKKRELNQFRDRINSNTASFKEEAKYKNERLIQPISTRAQSAIEAVVKKNGYTKWVDKNELDKYPGARDIMALVKNKLASTPNLTTSIQFENNSFNLGSSSEEKEIVYDIKFTNTGKAPLTISNVASLSKCVKLQWPQKAIKSGESGIIKLNYDGVNCTGGINQSITVVSNANESPNYLQIRGYVGTYLKNELSSQFLKIMKAYPGNFESLKEGLVTDAYGEYFSNVLIEQSRRTVVNKGTGNKNYVLSLIGSFDSKEKSLEKYQELLKIINSINLNGAALKVYQNEQTKEFTNTKWKLDNSKNSISKEYQQFTIELLCIHMKLSTGVSIIFGKE